MNASLFPDLIMNGERVPHAVILPIARARLTDDDLAVMKRQMLERRGIGPALEDE